VLAVVSSGNQERFQSALGGVHRFPPHFLHVPPS
jgi:hypothetical protein